MHRDAESVNQLPETYAAILRLRNERLSDAEIAERIGVEPEAVASLLLLARAKLAIIRRSR